LDDGGDEDSLIEPDVESALPPAVAAMLARVFL
jgi:hypothetical protein